MAFAKGIHVSKNNALNPKQQPLHQIEKACKQLGKLQHDLEAAIDSFADNKSLLSRAAAYWGQWPLWVQISGGFLLAFSLLIFSMAISMVTLACYTAVALLLNDHHSLLRHNTQKFKTIMQNLTNLLGTLVGLINNVHEQLKNEIERVQEKNQQLQQNVDQLHEQRSTLAEQINELTEAEKKLQSIINTHELTITRLKETNEEQSELFQTIQNQLTEVTEQSEEIQTQLSEKIDQLEQMRMQMESEHEQMVHTVFALKNSVISLSNPVLVKEEHQELLKQKLQEFVTSKEKDLSHFAISTSQINLDLEITQKQLHESLQQQAELRQDLERLIKEFEQLMSFYDGKKTLDDQKSLEVLKKFSFLTQSGTASSSIPPEPNENHLNL
ncbi:MAG: hypothetical protein P4L79_12985 [Legionella sp.]|uniref:hypothetical protein n=1 Tax=Legionella sp. TaxID=459 RepID=UPI00284AC54D|nr:hypothetical protein [Legionella sp.]